jgi:prepilin-type N-terminal cleavage/methylation domain-containing protein
MRKKANRLHVSRKGFTIAEMMAVVAIIALLASAGGGIYIGTYRHLCVKQAARDLLVGAKYAKVTAVERQQICRLEFSPELDGFQLTVDEPDEQGDKTATNLVRDVYFRPVQFAGAVRVEDSDIKPTETDYGLDEDELTQILFYPDGTAQGAVVQLGDGVNHYTVSICAATGKVKVFEGLLFDAPEMTIDLDER